MIIICHSGGGSFEDEEEIHQVIFAEEVVIESWMVIGGLTIAKPRSVRGLRQEWHHMQRTEAWKNSISGLWISSVLPTDGRGWLSCFDWLGRWPLSPPSLFHIPPVSFLRLLPPFCSGNQSYPVNTRKISMFCCLKHTGQDPGCSLSIKFELGVGGGEKGLVGKD